MNSVYIAYYGWITVDSELERMWMKTVVTWFEGIFTHFSAATKEEEKRPQPGESVSQTRFEPATSRIRARKVISWANSYGSCILNWMCIKKCCTVKGIRRIKWAAHAAWMIDELYKIFGRKSLREESFIEFWRKGRDNLILDLRQKKKKNRREEGEYWIMCFMNPFHKNMGPKHHIIFHAVLEKSNTEIYFIDLI
jgi:hypothetical protein